MITRARSGRQGLATKCVVDGRNRTVGARAAVHGAPPVPGLRRLSGAIPGAFVAYARGQRYVAHLARIPRGATGVRRSHSPHDPRARIPGEEGDAAPNPFVELTTTIAAPSGRAR